MDEEWLAQADIYISDATIEKLEREHKVTVLEIEEALYNATGPYLVDDRPKNLTAPLTRWTLSETTNGRLLKLVFKPYFEDRLIHIKSAYAPDSDEIKFFNSIIEEG